jgi:hypothetical protein
VNCCTLQLSLCHALVAYGGLEVQLHALVTPTLDGEKLASRPDRFKHGDKDLDVHCVDPSSVLDTVRKRTSATARYRTPIPWYSIL